MVSRQHLGNLLNRIINRGLFIILTILKKTGFDDVNTSCCELVDDISNAPFAEAEVVDVASISESTIKNLCINHISICLVLFPLRGEPFQDP